MTKDEALKMAIEAIEFKGVRDSEEYWQMMNATKNTCKEALEQPAQEPVAWIKEKELGGIETYKKMGLEGWGTNLGILTPEPDDIALYTHPHQWQGLTDEERYLNEGRSPEEIEYAIAIEQALKQKNNR
jgi:hypothetical protein